MMQTRRRHDNRAGGALCAVFAVAIVLRPSSAFIADACFASASFPAIALAATAPSTSTTPRCARRRPFPPPAYAKCPRPMRTKVVRLRAFNGVDEGSAVRYSDSKEKEQTRSKIVGGGSMIRNRKNKVDRTNVYTDEDDYDDFDVDEYCWLDDDGNMQGESCLISHEADSFPSPPKQPGWFDSGDFSFPPSIIDVAIRYVPIVCPLLAFQTYEKTASVFDSTMKFVSDNNWVAVDGGQYQTQIITPAINGIVVPSMALLFATLVSTTINTLRQRQMGVRTILNTEANDLRMLATMIDSGFTVQGDRHRYRNSRHVAVEEADRMREEEEEMRAVRNQLRSYLVQYASRVIAESKPGSTLVEQETIGSMDSEINGFLGVLNRVNVDGHLRDGATAPLPANYRTSDDVSSPPSASRKWSPSSTTFHAHDHPGHVNDGDGPEYIYTGGTGSVPATDVTHRRIPDVVLCECYDSLTRIRAERATRMSALQSTFPPLHYAILVVLAGSISLAFLMETNQELLIFLSAIQLRLLWAMLIGTFSALAAVNYDMIDPFRGSYNVAISVDQFYTIREVIRASIKVDAADSMADTM